MTDAPENYIVDTEIFYYSTFCSAASYTASFPYYGPTHCDTEYHYDYSEIYSTSIGNLVMDISTLPAGQDPQFDRETMTKLGGSSMRTTEGHYTKLYTQTWMHDACSEGSFEMGIALMVDECAATPQADSPFYYLQGTSSKIWKCDDNGITYENTYDPSLDCGIQWNGYLQSTGSDYYLPHTCQKSENIFSPASITPLLSTYLSTASCNGTAKNDDDDDNGSYYYYDDDDGHSGGISSTAWICIGVFVPLALLCLTYWCIIRPPLMKILIVQKMEQEKQEREMRRQREIELEGPIASTHSPFGHAIIMGDSSNVVNLQSSGLGPPNLAAQNWSFVAGTVKASDAIPIANTVDPYSPPVSRSLEDISMEQKIKAREEKARALKARERLERDEEENMPPMSTEKDANEYINPYAPPAATATYGASAPPPPSYYESQWDSGTGGSTMAASRAPPRSQFNSEPASLDSMGYSSSSNLDTAPASLDKY